VEVELNWLATDKLLLGGNLSFTDATYDEFFGECGAIPNDPQPDGTCSYAGFNLIYAPEVKGTVFADYTVPDAFGEWDFSFRGTVSYTDEYFTNASYQPGEFQDSYSKVDATLQLVSPNDNYRISLMGKNLTEEEIVDWSILVAGTYFAYLKPPREISVTFSADF
jgi:iron complex outermembrane receptor protein